MDKTNIQLLFQYNRWANARVLAACRDISEEDMYAPAQCSFGSLIDTLAHIHSSERAWRMRLQEGVSPKKLVTGADFASFDDLRQSWEADQAQMQMFVSSLDGADLLRWVEYTTLSGNPQASTLWKVLMHVVIHGAQFRAEAGAVMAGLGHSPGDLDFILYLRETDQR